MELIKTSYESDSDNEVFFDQRPKAQLQAIRLEKNRNLSENNHNSHQPVPAPRRKKPTPMPRQNVVQESIASQVEPINQELNNSDVNSNLSFDEQSNEPVETNAGVQNGFELNISFDNEENEDNDISLTSHPVIRSRQGINFSTTDLENDILAENDQTWIPTEEEQRDMQTDDSASDENPEHIPEAILEEIERVDIPQEIERVDIPPEIERVNIPRQRPENHRNSNSFFNWIPYTIEKDLRKDGGTLFRADDSHIYRIERRRGNRIFVK